MWGIEMDGSYARVWHYQVKSTRVEEFERTYGPAGSWSRIFKACPGYNGTVLLKKADGSCAYITLDFWQDEASFREASLAELGEYQALDTECEAYTEEERDSGGWSVLRPDSARTADPVA